MKGGMGCLSLRKWLFFPQKPMSTHVHPCPPMFSLLFPQDITCFPSEVMSGHGWTWVDMGGHEWTWVDMSGHEGTRGDMGGHEGTWWDMMGHCWTLVDIAFS